MQSGALFCNAAIRRVHLIALFICEPVWVHTGSQRSGGILSELPAAVTHREGAGHEMLTDGSFVFALSFRTHSVFYKGVSCN